VVLIICQQINRHGEASACSRYCGHYALCMIALVLLSLGSELWLCMHRWNSVRSCPVLSTYLVYVTRTFYFHFCFTWMVLYSVDAVGCRDCLTRCNKTYLQCHMMAQTSSCKVVLCGTNACPGAPCDRYNIYIMSWWESNPHCHGENLLPWLLILGCFWLHTSSQRQIVLINFSLGAGYNCHGINNGRKFLVMVALGFCANQACVHVNECERSFTDHLSGSSFSWHATECNE